MRTGRSGTSGRIRRHTSRPSMPGQAQIEDEQVDMADADALERAHPVAGDLDGVALALRARESGSAIAGVVLGQQDRGHVRELIPPPIRPSSTRESVRSASECAMSCASRYVRAANVRFEQSAPPHFVHSLATSCRLARERGPGNGRLAPWSTRGSLARRPRRPTTPTTSRSHCGSPTPPTRSPSTGSGPPTCASTRKPDRTPVTDADTAAEDALRAVLGDGAAGRRGARRGAGRRAVGERPRLGARPRSTARRTSPAACRCGPR